MVSSQNHTQLNITISEPASVARLEVGTNGQRASPLVRFPCQRQWFYILDREGESPRNDVGICCSHDIRCSNERQLDHRHVQRLDDRTEVAHVQDNP
jgi:hypothetical protein